MSQATFINRYRRLKSLPLEKKGRIAAAVAVIFFFVGSHIFNFLRTGELESDMDLVAASPSWHHPFGCDSMGRDLLARIFQASSVTLTLGLATAVFAMVFGATYGFLSASISPRISELLRSFLEVLMSIPQLILISLVVLFFHRHIEGEWSLFFALAFAMAIGSWMFIAKVTHALVERERTLAYIEAARGIGASPIRIALFHILPNIRNELLTFVGLQIPGFLLFESMLSFVGVGLQPPTASWGLLIQEGWKTLSNFPHLVLAPAMVLFILVFLINFSLSGGTNSEQG